MKKAKAWLLIQTATFLNVIFGIIAAHVLLSVEFGKFATIVAVLAIMVSILNPIINELSRIVSLKRGIQRSFLIKVSKGSVLVCVVIALLSCGSIVQNLHQGILLYFLLPLLLVCSSWPAAVLMGLNQMVEAGTLQICGAGIKLIVFLIGLLFFSEFTTAVWGYIAGFAAVFLFGMIYTKGRYNVQEAPSSMSVTVIVGFFLLALPFSLDQVLVQSFYPHFSGQYAAIMTYAKIVMLASAPALAIAYGSAIQINAERQEESALPMRAIFQIFIVTSILIFLLGFISPWAFPLLLGPQYRELIPFIGMGLFGIGMHVVAYRVFQTLLLSVSWWLVPVLILPPVLQAVGFLLYGSESINTLLFITVCTFLLQMILAIGSYLCLAKKV